MTAEEVFRAIRDLPHREAMRLARLLLEKPKGSALPFFTHFVGGVAVLLPADAWMDLEDTRGELSQLKARNAKRHRPANEERNAAIVAEYEAGKKAAAIAARFKMTEGAVRKVLARAREQKE